MGKCEELLNSGVSGNGKMAKVLQWENGEWTVFSAMGKCEELLNSGVSAMGKW
jgi:hypothetical protein